MRFLSVDVTGVVTNDGVHYLERSTNPFGEGFVTDGYRQVAYPATLWTSNVAGAVLGWDHIFGIALLQRAMLASAIAVTIWAMRWWSVPVIALTTSATYVAQVNFLLPEGVLVPISLLVGALLAAVVLGRVRTTGAARILYVALCLAVAYAAAVKMQYAAMVAVAAAAGWSSWRDGLVSRRLVVAGVAAVVGFVVVLATIQSVENRHEYGVFEPISERSLAEWYGAWTAVFVVHPDNAADPALAEWYDGGSPYPAFQDAVARSPDYAERRELLRHRIDEMFDAAGTTPTAERLDAFAGALLGARTDDIERFVDGVLARAPGDGRAGLADNEYGQQDRVDELLADLNDGQPPGVVTTGPLFDATQRSSADYRDVKGALAAVALALMAIAVTVPGRHRPACIGVLATVLLIAAALATGYIDNARYLVGPLTIMTIGGVLAARGLVLRLASLLTATTEGSGVVTASTSPMEHLPPHGDGDRERADR